MKAEFLIAFLMLFSLSCDKHRAKKHAGTYFCSVYSHSWDIQGNHTDSSYTEVVTVEHDGKNVIVLGQQIHVENLKENSYYEEGEIHNNFKIKFVKDSLYFESYSGGLGGGGGITFKGEK